MGTAYQFSFVSFQKGILQIVNTSPCSKAPFAQARSVGCQGRDEKLYVSYVGTQKTISEFTRHCVFLPGLPVLVVKPGGTRCAIFLILKRTVYLHKIYNTKFYF